MKRFFILTALVTILNGLVKAEAPGWSCLFPNTITSLPFSGTRFDTGVMEGTQPPYNSLNAQLCGSNYMDGKDYYFSYTPIRGEYVKLVVSNASQVGVGLFVFSDCPSVSGSCYLNNESYGGTPSLDNVWLEANHTYFFVVSTNPGVLFGKDYVNFDFSIERKNYDASILSLISPISGCGNLSSSLTVSIKNNGSLQIGNFPITASVNGSSVTENYTSNIAAGATANFTFNHNFDFSNAGVYNIQVNAALVGDVDSNNDLLNTTINRTVGITVYPHIDSFESNSTFISHGTNSSWEAGMPNAQRINIAAVGNNAYVTNLTGNCNQGELSYLESPCFDFTNMVRPILKFQLWLENSADGSLTIQYTLNNGNTWTILPYVENTVGWFNNIDFWRGNTGKYFQVERPLNEFLTENSIRFRFVFNSGTTDNEGVSIDNFKIDDCNIIPIASFTSQTSGKTVTFDNNTANGIYYRWDFGDGSSYAYSENVQHTFPSDNSYTVTLIAYNDCGSDTITYTIDIATNINSVLMSNKYLVSPNPANDIVYFSGDLKSIISVKIIDMNGKIIISNLNFTGNKININTLHKGIYIIEVKSENGIERIRFCKN